MQRASAGQPRDVVVPVVISATVLTTTMHKQRAFEANLEIQHHKEQGQEVVLLRGKIRYVEQLSQNRRTGSNVVARTPNASHVGTRARTCHGRPFRQFEEPDQNTVGGKDPTNAKHRSYEDLEKVFVDKESVW